jgi:hypothetical protein
VVAAVQAKRMGKTVSSSSRTNISGGLSSGGLGFTDTGNKAVIGGLSREFYHRVWKRYDDAAAWTWQKREEYGNKGRARRASTARSGRCGSSSRMWPNRSFEDLVASTRFRSPQRMARIASAA